MSTAGWRVPINVKLLAILAVPVLGYLALATAAVAQAQTAAWQIDNQANLLRTAVGPISLTTSLIDERTITSLEAADLQEDLTLRVGSSTEARRATDEQLGALQTLIDDNSEAREAYGPAVDQLAGQLQTLRADVDAGRDEASAFEQYDEFINTLMDANAVAVDRLDDAELWQGAMLSELATRQKEARAVLIEALIPVSINEDGGTSTEQTASIGQALGAYETRDSAIRELATGPYAPAGSVLIDALEGADLAALARSTLDNGALDSTELFDVASYKGGFIYDAPSGDYIHDYFRARIVEVLDAEASRRTAAAADDVRTNVLAGSIGLVVTAGITWLVSRSITRPLRSLTLQAIDTATQRLPGTVHEIQETPLGEDVSWPQMEPIGVTTKDEVADVARAFNTMQQSALDLAVEEALLRRLVTDSLVTLGQRNQDLLSRQLAFITDLERDETNPDTLADLFHLDHLAIRMRRNAESLLVLAGIDPPRTWLGPSQIGDIIRAALGEAEEYKHVRVQEVEAATIAGSATAELSHLLAELIENALRFSLRGQAVEVNGRHRGSVSGDGYTVTIADAGVGMSVQDLDLANRRLAGLESPGAAPSRYMGHYVTGKLAARHGITVVLSRNPGKGLTATIDIPGRLLTAEEPVDAETPLPQLPRAEAPLPPLPQAAAAGPPPSEPATTAASASRDTRSREEWDVPTADVPTADVPATDVPADRPAADLAAAERAKADLAAAEEPAPEFQLLDLPEPDPLPRLSASARKASGPVARKPRKRKMRALPANKLPVPPPPTEPLVIDPVDAASDTDPPDPTDEPAGQADQAS